VENEKGVGHRRNPYLWEGKVVILVEWGVGGFQGYILQILFSSSASVDQLRTLWANESPDHQEEYAIFQAWDSHKVGNVQA